MKAKKHLGQNFLTSKKFIDDVVRAAQISDQDTVLEIGPGKGALTKPLLKGANRVVAIEKDTNLAILLRKKFDQDIKDERFTLVCGDALDVDISSVINAPYQVVANIPYNITGLILRHFLSQQKQPESMTLVVQKEVAERLVCRDGKESVLSLSVAAYGTARVIEKIPARYFTPKPNVDSAIIHIDNISRDFFKDIDEEKFFQILKTGFSHKRKKLISNLEILFPKDVLVDSFSRCNVALNARAEEVSQESWHCIAGMSPNNSV